MMLIFEEEVIRVICAFASQFGKSECKKNQFYNDMASEWDSQNPGEVVLVLENFKGHAGRRINDFEGGHGIVKKNVEERRLLKFCDEKE